MRLIVMFVGMCSLFSVLQKTSAVAIPSDQLDQSTDESSLSDSEISERRSKACLEFEILTSWSPYNDEIAACISTYEDAYAIINRTREEIQQIQEESERLTSTLAKCNIFLQILLCRNNNKRIQREIDSLNLSIELKEVINAVAIENADTQLTECEDKATKKEEEREVRIYVVGKVCLELTQPKVTTEETTTDQETTPNEELEESKESEKSKETNESKTSKESKESKATEESKESKESEESKESKKSKESEESNETEETKESEASKQSEESKESKESKASKESKESKDDSSESDSKSESN